MHGEEGEQRIHGRHMWSVLKSATSSVADSSSVAAITSDSFSKDGRKISIGDCALFKPPQDSPPFIGIIRRLISKEAENLRLSVNWLYRPADVKLGKGALFEAAPNEVFYSFHKDEIPAASILHPCKVAFLRKGVELPPGISSFVCRRVYDIEYKCLWWLTDQDYINERQEEVDQLIQKTRLEMYGALQSGGRSPKGLNGTSTTGSQQLRSGSESAQNNNNSPLPSQIKIKKRDRVDQVSDPVKRERLSRVDDTSFGQHRSDLILKSEIAKITDKGGLVDFEGVEKLVQLMQPQTAEKKVNLACRMMLVDVIAVTDKFDCLGWFVQLGGLAVLHEWLQEVHKGKLGDGSSSKDNDKSGDEFLLVLLRALDKLPVNLHALQTCNVGKSVNHLRTHKNPEIQRKARSLVDTWKKRVEAEMNILDGKSGSSRGGSWPTKSVLPEVSPTGNRRSGGPPEVTGKSSSPHSSGKLPSAKFGSGDSVAKVIATSPISSKAIASVSASAAPSTKDPDSVALTGLDPLSTIKEEKSSSSSHSQNNSQSCSSDHAKTVGSSCREDTRSSTAGSMSGSKISVTGRHRKSNHNLQGSALSAVKLETGLGKLSSSKSMGSEKVSPPGGTPERVCDVPIAGDHGNGQRLIVRLPNTGRSPARSSTGVPYEDPTASSKDSVSARSAKPDHHDRKITGKSDALQSSNVSKGDMEDKNALARSDDGNLSPPGAFSSDKKQSADDNEKVIEALKGANLSSRVKPRAGNFYDVSFRSMNALVESCVKFSEASNTASGGDDIGMNLLASVAAGEISRSDGSASVSLGRNLPVPEESCSGNDVNSRHLDEDTARSEGLASDQGIGKAVLVHSNPIEVHVKNESSHDAICTLAELSRDNKSLIDASKSLSSEDAMMKDYVENEGAGGFHDQIKSGDIPSTTNADLIASRANDKSAEGNGSVLLDVAADTKPVMKEATGESPTFSSTEVCWDEKGDLTCKNSGCGMSNEEKPSVKTQTHQESMVGREEAGALPSSPVNGKVGGKTTDTDAASQIDQSVKQNGKVPLDVSDQTKDLVESDKNDLGHCPDIPSPEEPPLVPLNETDGSEKSNGDNADGLPNVAVKLDFDLNEGFPLDDGSFGELAKSPVHGDMSSVQLSCPLPSPMASIPGSFRAPVTFASAAKGSFSPPEGPFKCKGELGWKGSAATSAFRPAEPRKTSDSSTGCPPLKSITSKPERRHLDIDLNVADERVLEDVVFQCSETVKFLESECDHRGGGLDLDLNRVEDCHEVRKMGIPLVLSKPSLPCGFGNAELNASRDIDLNSGPGPDEIASETTMRAKSNMPFISPLPGVKMSATGQGSLSSWFPQGHPFPQIAATSVRPCRGEQGYPIISASGSQRIVGHPAGITSFGPEFYRGPVLSSSPALPFPSAVPFQYPFPFETNFPMPSHSYSNTSTSFPSASSQLVGPSSAVSSHYPRPYVINVPGGASNTPLESRRWVTQALDLNAGLGSADVECRDERFSSALQQSPIPGSQALPSDEQLRMYQMAGGLFKRKELDGGWDGDRTNYKLQ